MSRALPPHQVLSQLEEQKKDELTLKLAALGKRRGELAKAIDETDARLAEVSRSRELLGLETTTALELSALEAERQQEKERKGRLLQELEMLAFAENELRVEILVCMSKSKAYSKLQENETKLQQKHAERAEQRSIDDMMAYRRTNGEQS